MADAPRDWKSTLQLPETEFPMRGDLIQREPETIARWEKERLYHRMIEARDGAPRFTLHDGPPYANGDIHHGHALNKILKDIVIKAHHLDGFRSDNIPGWDCHGLPIEQKVDEELGKKKADLSTVQVREHCRNYAQRWVNTQSEQFQRLLVLAEWERPYLTMSFNFEASTFREIGRVMEKGYVYNGLKPVHWSWSAVTALADAEVEYAPYDAPSVYVRFAFTQAPDWLREAAGGRSIDAVIWTTTPWTLASNLAIVLHPELEYELLALDDDSAILVAAGRKEVVLSECGLPDLPVLTRFEGARLVGTNEVDSPRLEARHPFIDRPSVLIPAEYVTLEQGTGLVHTAPGHGADDFETGKRFGLGTLAPVDPRGCYTGELAEMGDFAASLVGVHVFKANPLVSTQLEETGRLLNKAGAIYRVDRYPHCWRTKKPLIFRATAQWFINVDHDKLRGRALEAIGQTQWIPHWGEARIRGMIEQRPDWCISRQRVWGVPIPAFSCRSCGQHVVSHEVAYHVADLCETEGADVWFKREAAELVPQGFTCACGAGPENFDKVEDILDVWFDSGVSWAAVLRDREGGRPWADLYLEGSDQHRGWFHTSLLASVATQGRAPYEAVLTHGFVVDEQGHKYSKSSPRFEPLAKMLESHGAEVLRLWVSMVDYRQDITLAPELLKQAGGSYRKIRNTLRFLLGNLQDFDPAVHTLDDATLTPIDRWALHQTREMVARTRDAYQAYEFQRVFSTLYDFCNDTLSAVYLDALKDRLYCSDPNLPARRASQAVLYEALRALVVMMAPVLSFTADEAWGFFPRRSDDPDNVFLGRFPNAADYPAQDAAEHSFFNEWLEVRSLTRAAIEARRPKQKGERLEGQIGSSQEAVVTLRVPAEELARWEAAQEDLLELLIVSEFRLEALPAGATEKTLDVEVSEEPRCERCWNQRPDVGSHESHPDLCGRCASVIEKSA